jgi:hypothetical protein
MVEEKLKKGRWAKTRKASKKVENEDKQKEKCWIQNVFFFCFHN